MNIRIRVLGLFGLVLCALAQPVFAQQQSDDLSDLGDGDDGDSGDGDTNGDIGDLLGDVSNIVGAVVAGEEFYREWDGLDAEVDSCGASWRDSSAPTVPSSCAESRACAACYEHAVHEINFNRHYIERARCITAANVKMANSAMAFGDSTSGIHGVAGLSWQLQGKPQIKEAVEGLKRTYSTKAGQYLDNLDRSMQQLGQCEAEHYGERDWYQRYGWVYVNFMKAKYATPPE